MSVSFHPMLHIESSSNPSMNHSSVHPTIHSAQTLVNLSKRQCRQTIHFPGCYEKTMTNLIPGLRTDIGTQNLRKAIHNTNYINPLNPELNPICYLLALLGAHHFLRVSRIRVKSLTIRLLMSYIYGAPILDVSRSYTTTHHSR